MQSSIIIILGTFIPLVVGSIPDGNQELVVETKSGIVRGKIVTGYTQKDVRAFYGIPYAEPPIGNLRFKPPVPVVPWKNEFDATRVPLPCYQQYTKDSLRYSRKMHRTVRRPWSENCLTLNIWTPVQQLPDTPIFVMFHSGGFMTGTGAYPYNDYATHSAESNLMYVSINYRLGAFGFLSLGIPDFPGNLGLMDQHLALKWIHENGAHFGGKNNAIFLIGFEAGSASIGHQLIIPENKGLFKTVIINSGSALCDWAWQSKEDAVKSAKILSGNLGCESINFTNEQDCLQNAHPEDILDATLVNDDINTIHFRPNIDGKFVKEVPEEAMKAGRFNNVNIIVGVTKNEGSLRFLTMNEDQIKGPGSNITAEGFKEAIKRDGLAHTITELDLIYNWYLGENCFMNGTNIRDAAIEAYSDGGSICCVEKFLEYANQNGSLIFKFVFDIPDPRYPDWIGAHDQLIFSIFHSTEVFEPKNNFTSEMVNAAISTFRFTGQHYRLKDTAFESIVPRYNLVDRPYLLWSSEQRVFNNHRTQECVLWNKIIPEMRKRKCSS